MNLEVRAQSSLRNCSMSCAVIYSIKKTFYKVLNLFGNEIIYSKTLIYPDDKLFFLAYCLKLNSITFTKMKINKSYKYLTVVIGHMRIDCFIATSILHI